MKGSGFSMRAFRAIPTQKKKQTQMAAPAIVAGQSWIGNHLMAGPRIVFGVEFFFIVLCGDFSVVAREILLSIDVTRGTATPHMPSLALHDPGRREEESISAPDHLDESRSL